MSEPIPEGFRPLNRGGAYLAALGPWYYRRDDQGRLVLAIRVEERHTNNRHIAHGGLLLTLCDTALGVVLSGASEPPQPMVTVNMATNFVASARPGDWLEAHVDVTRIGKRLAYGTCQLMVGQTCVMTATGIFAIMNPVVPKEQSEG